MKLKKTFYKKGFSLVELVIVMGIFVVMAGLVLFNFSSFQSTRSLDATAQELATVVREAQIYGISVSNIPGSEIFPAYGLHVDYIAAPRDVVLFADLDGDRVYDPGDGEEVSTFRIETPIDLYNICTSQTGEDTSIASNGFRCYRDDTGTIINEINQITAVFERPDPEPYVYDNILDPLSNPSRAFARIDLIDDEGFGKSIYVWKSGQIGVTNPFTDVTFAEKPVGGGGGK
ncbi:hypothetical protein CL654_03280 [bacterium]|nr:hypothetical protein [bacterium]|tara:strand:- start:5842 stop:6534 length:693 start_codon:yes stop_codon:yes gene_type:complete